MVIRVAFTVSKAVLAMAKSRDSCWKTFDIFEKFGRMSAKRQVIPMKLYFSTLSASPLAAATPVQLPHPEQLLMLANSD